MLLACGLDGQYLYIVDGAGEVITNQGPPPSKLYDAMEYAVERAGYEVDTVNDWHVDLNVGDSVKNWESFITVR